jgi:N-hydroxyarylamine O-acetyltransferase
MMNVAAYLKRIAYQGPLAVDWETLRGIHRAHANAIPYENLDAQLRRPTTIDPSAAFDKIVSQRRGGWCYEMNGVLGAVLEAIGFKVTRLAANGSSQHSHLVLTVRLDDVTYVCDVGFSDGPIDPYPLVEGSFVQDGFEFRVELLPDNQWRVHNHRFGMAPYFVAVGPNEKAMEARCQWLQTSPDSPFVQHVTLVKRTQTGFVSLVDRTLRQISPTGVTRTTVESAADFVTTIRDVFTLDVSEVATLWPAVCERHEVYLREAAARRAAKSADAR